jgi:hypothetical protein
MTKMTKILKITLIYYCIFTSPLIYSLGNFNTNNLALQVSEEGSISPEFFIPYQWNNVLNSGFGYYSDSSTEIDQVSGLSQSRKSNSTQQQVIRLNGLTYAEHIKNINYSIGAGVNWRKISNEEFGYFYLAGQVDDWIAFDNKANIRVIQPLVNGLIGWQWQKNTQLKLAIDLYPLNQLSVKQSGRFKPIVENESTLKSNDSQKLSYRLGIDLQYKLKWLNIGLSLSREILPLTYQYQKLTYNSESNKFTLVDSTSDIEELTEEIMIKINIEDIKLFGLPLSIGYGKQRFVSNDLIEKEQTTETVTVYSLGVEQWF